MEAFDSGEPASDLASVFSWSYRRLSEPAARLLRAISHLPRADIALEAAASAVGWRRRATRTAASELCRANLLLEPAPGRFALHDLVHAYGLSRAEELDSPDERRRARVRIYEHYSRTAQDAAALLRPHRAPPPAGPPVPGVSTVHLSDDDHAVRWFDLERAALRALSHSAVRERDDQVAAQLARAQAPFLERRASWTDLAAVGRIALDATRALDDGAGQLDALSILGRAHLRRGDVQGARACHDEALRLAVRHGDPAKIAAAHFDLAVLEDTEGSPAASLRQATQARLHYRAADDAAAEAYALNAMGWDHIQLGEPERAVAYCHEAIGHCRKRGSRHGEAATWDTLGLAQHLLGEHGQAVDAYREGLALVAETGDQALEAAMLDRLGDALTAGGDAQAARETWHRAMRVVDAGEVRGVEWTAQLRAELNSKLAAAAE